MVAPVTIITLKRSEPLRLNRICSQHSFYNKRYNELEVCFRHMVERGYSDKLVRQQIFKAPKRKKKDLFDNIIEKIKFYKVWKIFL